MEFIQLAVELLLTRVLEVTWRLGLLTLLGGVVGVLMLWLCYRGIYRKELLRLSLPRWDRSYEGLVLGLWIVTLPTFGVACGTLGGAWWAGNHLIAAEHVGERLGRAAFQSLAAGLLATSRQIPGVEDGSAVDALLRGEEKIAVQTLSIYTSRHLGELSANRLWSYSPVHVSSLHGATAWTMEKTANLVIASQLGGEADAAQRLVAQIIEHDRTSDRDGLVTVEEMSEVACRTFGDKLIKGLWAVVVLEFLIPLALLWGSLPWLPALLAWLVRRGVAWRRARSGARRDGG